ncbi:hypothetical protein NC651_005412 [Populus alba x Populus x berolinensis]|nr:hypothetical protein NC651_005412 [Populus alba x Populus x berolinensis]
MNSFHSIVIHLSALVVFLLKLSHSKNYYLFTISIEVTLCIAGKSSKHFRLHESPGQALDNYWKLDDFDAGFWLLKSE